MAAYQPRTTRNPSAMFNNNPLMPQMLAAPMSPAMVYVIASPPAQQPHQQCPVRVTVGAVKPASHASPTALSQPLQQPHHVLNSHQIQAQAPTSTCGGAVETIPLIDPTGFGGLIQVPLSKTLDTKGRAEYLKGTLKKDVSLCCLYQKGRCHAQEKCHQIHVDLAFMRNVRSQNAGVISCCPAHRDSGSATPAAQAFFAKHLGQTVVPLLGADGAPTRTISSAEVAFTVGLQAHADDAGSACTLPLRSLCRLHLRGACKYGKDCKRIHVCSKLGEGILTESAQPALALPPNVAAAHSEGHLRCSPRPVTVHVRSDSLETAEVLLGGSARLNAQTPPPHASARSTQSTPGTDVHFSPVFLRSPATRRNSLGSDAGSVGPATPPPLETLVKDVDAPITSFTQQEERPALSLGAMDAMGVSSFLEHSYKVQGLCFDPLLLCEQDAELWGPASQHSCRTNVSEMLDQSMESGASSTTSHASATRHSTSVWM